MNPNSKLVKVFSDLAVRIICLSVGQVIVQLSEHFSQLIRVGFSFLFQKGLDFFPTVRIFSYKSNFTHKNKTFVICQTNIL